MSDMERITPKNWDFSLPRLGVGGMRFPLLDPQVSSSIDREQVGRMVDYAIAHGANYFDTAYPYHDHTAEQALGGALAGGPAGGDHRPFRHVQHGPDGGQRRFLLAP